MCDSVPLNPPIDISTFLMEEILSFGFIPVAQYEIRYSYAIHEEALRIQLIISICILFSRMKSDCQGVSTANLKESVMLNKIYTQTILVF